MAKKYIIISAPSGAGKSSLIKQLVKRCPELKFWFSVSMTTRQPREGEVNGKDYYFCSPEQFRYFISKGDFLEYEEVFRDKYYGTPRWPVETLSDDVVAIFDVDVKGACRLMEKFGDNALSVFINVPSLDVLRQRLSNRGTETETDLTIRLMRARREMEYASRFDVRVLNDDVKRAGEKLSDVVRAFVNDDARMI